ncbi:alcohol dehydrogenase catalytic domain-containing protein [Streptomyces niveus]|uniref:alcohol dehydrogenase catalytic domain-containing protein n=1 Tax=Streptomyces niveus TaxID=193462 RepID=UPI003419BD04
MRSWRFHGTGRPLTQDEVEVPRAGPGEVVVDIKAAGLCHSDVGALNASQWLASFPRIPMTLGHENAGLISEVGPGMEDWRVGDRVGLAPVMPDGDAIGYGAWDGGYGPKVRATGANLVRLPQELSFELGAMATDAGITSYHAMVTVGGLKKGMRVGVIGLGAWVRSARASPSSKAPRSTPPTSTPPPGSTPPRSGWREWPSPSPSSRTKTCR